jgi:allophanate hydrolase
MNIPLTIESLHKAYAEATTTPKALFSQLLEEAATLDKVWIHLLSEAEIAPYIEGLADKSPATHPLYGVPFAIKDNIDLANIPTTAACPDFAYTPENSAFVVQQLIDAGAVPLGKTNLDQFATGLVGTRSPYGATPNAFDAEFISGGSSAGSAVATAKGVVTFALGTDTAGSGRVPACFNNLVGLKPSKGALSTSGVVPACRSLDCVSIFSLTAEDARTVFEVAAKYDHQDPYARKVPAANLAPVTVKPNFSFGVPLKEQLNFFGCSDYEQAYQNSIKQLEAIGGTAVEIDINPLLEAARLLYEGPWVAERYIATQDVIENTPEAMMDVTKTIISQGNKASAVDLFNALYKLQSLKVKADACMAGVDLMLSPTAGRHFTLAEIEEKPIERNSQLGYYTNFMNLLDYAAVAAPTAILDSGRSFGITLFSDAMTDQMLLAYAGKLQDSLKLPLGATAFEYEASTKTPASNSAYLDLVVCGAHLSGMALNWQLQERDAVLIESTQSASCYKMFAVPGNVERPAMIKVDEGSAFEVEVWRVPAQHIGSFIAGIAAPLGLGTVELADGRQLKGFIAEAYAAQGEDISSFGSWRRYVESKTVV